MFVLHKGPPHVLQITHSASWGSCTPGIVYPHMYLAITIIIIPKHVLLYPQSGSSALHLASHKGHTRVVRVLLDHGANVHAVTKVPMNLSIMLHVHDYYHTCAYSI